MKMSYDQKQKIFRVFYKRYFKRLVNYSVKKLNNQRYIAEDIAQETFLRAYDNIEKIYKKNEFIKWIYVVARNLSYNYTRDNKRNLSINTGLARSGQDEADSIKLDQVLGSYKDNPFQAVKKNELLAIVSNCLDRLSSDYRQAIELCLMEGLSYKKAAVALNTNESIIAHDLMRAKRKLHKMANL